MFVITVPKAGGGRRPLGEMDGTPHVFRTAEHAYRRIAELEAKASARSVYLPVGFYEVEAHAG